MTKGLHRTLTRGNHEVRQHINRMHVSVENVPISMYGNPGGYNTGSVVVGDFPKGNILLLGSVSYMEFAGPGSLNLADDWQGYYSIGTNPNASGMPGSSGRDIVDLGTLSPAVGEMVARKRVIKDKTSMLDNTDHSLEINFNLVIADLDITDTETVVITATGNLQLAFIALHSD